MLRVLQCVCQRQCAAPGAAKKAHPATDAQCLADTVEIPDQRLGIVVLRFTRGQGLAATALIKQHDIEKRRVKVAPMCGTGLTARAAMQEDNRVTASFTTALNV